MNCPFWKECGMVVFNIQDRPEDLNHCFGNFRSCPSFISRSRKEHRPEIKPPENGRMITIEELKTLSRLYFDTTYICARIKEVVKAFLKRLSERENKNPVVLIYIKEGATIFAEKIFAKLLPMLDASRIEYETGSMKTRRYNEDTSTSIFELIEDIPATIELAGKTVGIFEDIVDEGATIQFLRKHLISMGVKEKDIVIIAMIDKKVNRVIKLPEILSCISMMGNPEEFLWGSGLDLSDNPETRKVKEIWAIKRSLVKALRDNKWRIVA
ncbi:hypothetical protein A3F08_02650 [Candidatus Berkelbacteria bacterium RIFCSPHIGHO2_12_FULL_36_9]|uniref:Phosphoribosyltransferase domain-containing protein n=1 Tax=Candidatus Berkelbacteria bacterium RIFCSPHIGHO2_12_FULL_36_9 TaxID=1797469 RepID=A0A1F5EDN5_9BACT|nr:MAG: hypothetical protein A3F08_02650 [Candidatus Berkelbacteria bacterium RIFCSPHIGHO2_12_FULL_36_9]